MPGAELAAQKVELRRRMATLRDGLAAEEAGRRSVVICAGVEALCPPPAGRTIALYAAIGREVDVTPLGPRLRDKGARVVYPRVDRVRRELSFHTVDREQSLVATGPYHIPEPPLDAPETPPGSLDLIVVPGLAFDDRGYRLGWGAGFYDKVLPQAKDAGRIGVCYDFQLVPSCPHDDRDEPVQWIVTDLATFTMRKTP